MKGQTFILFTLILMSGCSSYINKMHSKLDGGEVVPQGQEGKFDIYKQKQKRRRRLPGQTTRNSNRVMPRTKRNYNNHKRVKISDMRDNSSEGSLWYGNGQQNYFFSKNKNRRPGDIVIIQVQKKLKKEIALELARSTPIRRIPGSKKKGDKGKGPPTKPSSQNKKEDSDNGISDKKIYDTISGVISESINKEHLLIKGRKDVLYKNRKRMIEIMALVARRDISEEDMVPSSKIIESAVSIVK